VGLSRGWLDQIRTLLLTPTYLKVAILQNGTKQNASLTEREIISTYDTSTTVFVPTFLRNLLLSIFRVNYLASDDKFCPSQSLEHPPELNSLDVKMEAECCSETLEQTKFTTRCGIAKDDRHMNKNAASLNRSHPIKFSDSSLTCTFIPFRCATCSAHLIHFDLIIVVRLREEYKLLRL
jgi:hypothetical protein